MSSAISAPRILVAGYGLPAEFGLSTLFGLGVRPENLAVLTHDNDQRNSGLHSLCELRSIKLCTASAKNAVALEFVRNFAPTLILSLHYRKLIPAEMLAMAPAGGINLHPSLLPAYRGTNSVQWVLINGETETGFTFHHMDASFDNGTILVQEAVPITETDTAFSLFHKLMVRPLWRLEHVIERALARDPGRAQVGEISYFPRQLPFDGAIDTSWDEARVERFIRAMYFPPFPPAKLVRNGETHLVPTLADYRRLMAD